MFDCFVKFYRHHLRYYSSFIQHALGIPDAYIMKRGGWEDDSVLNDVYRHAMEEQTKIINVKANAHFTQLVNPMHTDSCQKKLLRIFEIIESSSDLIKAAALNLEADSQKKEVVQLLKNLLMLLGFS